MSTPPLSARAGSGALVVGLNESQSTLRVKLRNTSRVYQSRPRPLGAASRMVPNRERKSPPPVINHPWREPLNNDLNAVLRATVWAATIASAVRRASVVAV